MNSQITLFIVLFGVVLLILLIVFLVTRTSGRPRNRMKVIAVDEKVGALKYFPINRKKGIQPYGKAYEVYPSGIGNKPYSMSPGWRTIHFPNAELIITKEFQDMIQTEALIKLNRLESEHNVLINNYSFAMARINQLESGIKDEMEREADTMGKFKEKLLPKFVIGRSSSTGGGQH